MVGKVSRFLLKLQGGPDGVVGRQDDYPPWLIPFPSSFPGIYNVDSRGSQTLTQGGDRATSSRSLLDGRWGLDQAGFVLGC